MQFVLMIYQGTATLPGTDAWKALPEAEQKRIYAEYGEINRTPGVAPGLPLGLPKDAKTVRVSNGGGQVTDGPYLDAGHAVGGYSFSKPTISAPHSDSLRAFPRRASAVRSEVRPVAKYW